jgi:hypothetical protein
MTEPTVRDQSDAVAVMAGDWALLNGLTGGTRAMRAAGKAMLPQFPAEEADAYSTRLGTAVLTNFFGRTCSVMAAKPFSQAMGETKVSPTIEGLLDDIDGQGSSLQAFSQAVFRGCLSHGIGGVLVDFPTVGAVLTKADERASGARPYWSHYPASTIIGCDAQRIGGQWRIMQVRLLEMASEPNGRFGKKSVEQVRVLEPGLWEIWRKADIGINEWVLHEAGTTTLDFVPFEFFYGNRMGFGVGQSPLLDLAYLNCEHWQSSSDQQTILHVARVPILFGKGFSDGASIKIGASSAVMTTDEKADLKFVEHSGEAIDSGRQSILDLEDRMRQLGAELLVKQRGNVTATQVVSEGNSDKCMLQSLVEAFESGLNSCLNFTGAWMNDQTENEVELFKDFGVDSLSDASTAILLDAASENLLSNETFFEELRRRSIIDSDREWAPEEARIKAQKEEAAKLAPVVAPTMPKLPVHPGKAD